MPDSDTVISAFKQCGLPGGCVKCLYSARPMCYKELKNDILKLLEDKNER